MALNERLIEAVVKVIDQATANVRANPKYGAGVACVATSDGKRDRDVCRAVYKAILVGKCSPDGVYQALVEARERQRRYRA